MATQSTENLTISAFMRDATYYQGLRLWIRLLNRTDASGRLRRERQTCYTQVLFRGPGFGWEAAEMLGFDRSFFYEIWIYMYDKHINYALIHTHTNTH